MAEEKKPKIVTIDGVLYDADAVLRYMKNMYGTFKDRLTDLNVNGKDQLDAAFNDFYNTLQATPDRYHFDNAGNTMLDTQGQYTNSSDKQKETWHGVDWLKKDKKIDTHQRMAKLYKMALNSVGEYKKPELEKHTRTWWDHFNESFGKNGYDLEMFLKMDTPTKEDANKLQTINRFKYQLADLDKYIKEVEADNKEYDWGTLKSKLDYVNSLKLLYKNLGESFDEQDLPRMYREGFTSDILSDMYNTDLLTEDLKAELEANTKALAEQQAQLDAAKAEEDKKASEAKAAWMKTLASRLFTPQMYEQYMKETNGYKRFGMSGGTTAITNTDWKHAPSYTNVKKLLVIPERYLFEDPVDYAARARYEMKMHPQYTDVKSDYKGVTLTEALDLILNRGDALNPETADVISKYIWKLKDDPESVKKYNITRVYNGDDTLLRIGNLNRGKYLYARGDGKFYKVYKARPWDHTTYSDANYSNWFKKYLENAYQEELAKQQVTSLKNGGILKYLNAPGALPSLKEAITDADKEKLNGMNPEQLILFIKEHYPALYKKFSDDTLTEILNTAKSLGIDIDENNAMVIALSGKNPTTAIQQFALGRQEANKDLYSTIINRSTEGDIGTEEYWKKQAGATYDKFGLGYNLDMTPRLEDMKKAVKAKNEPNSKYYDNFDWRRFKVLDVENSELFKNQTNILNTDDDVLLLFMDKYKTLITPESWQAILNSILKLLGKTNIEKMRHWLIDTEEGKDARIGKYMGPAHAWFHGTGNLYQLEDENGNKHWMSEGEADALNPDEYDITKTDDKNWDDYGITWTRHVYKKKPVTVENPTPKEEKHLEGPGVSLGNNQEPPKEKSKSSFNFGEHIPALIGLGDVIAHNIATKRNADSFPGPTLHSTYQLPTNIAGDWATRQAYRNMGLQIASKMNEPITSDADKQRLYQLEGLNQLNTYTEKGVLADNEAIAKSSAQSQENMSKNAQLESANHNVNADKIGLWTQAKWNNEKEARNGILDNWSRWLQRYVQYPIELNQLKKEYKKEQLNAYDLEDATNAMNLEIAANPLLTQLNKDYTAFNADPKNADKQWQWADFAEKARNAVASRAWNKHMNSVYKKQGFERVNPYTNTLKNYSGVPENYLKLDADLFMKSGGKIVEDPRNKTSRHNSKLIYDHINKSADRTLKLSMGLSAANQQLILKMFSIK